MKYSILLFFKSILYFWVFLLSITKSNAQIIDTPSFPFTQICANSSFNNFKVSFTFSPESSFTATNQFIVELSDASGSFLTSSTVVYTSTAGAITKSPASVEFSVPTSIAGENFKLRIRSTSPSITSPSSKTFQAYYKPQDRLFSINNFIPTAEYCVGGSYTLTIDNPGTGTNDSPLKYPTLTFNWFRETTATTSVMVASGETLEVTSPGTYFVATNYGTCTSNSVSNRVVVSESTTSSGVLTGIISSSLGNPFCVGGQLTTLTGPKGQSYQWSQDGSPINGASQQTYQTNTAGKYTVVVNSGSCITNASIDLKTDSVSSTFNLPKTNVIQPNSTLTATVTSSATNLTYEWFLDGVAIAGATTNSYDVKKKGAYKVTVKTTTGCPYSIDYTFNVTESTTGGGGGGGGGPLQDVPNIPTVVTPNEDGKNDKWTIPLEYAGTSGAEVIILSSQGEEVLKTDSYQNNWPDASFSFKNVFPVYYYIITTKDGKVKRGSITVVK